MPGSDQELLDSAQKCVFTYFDHKVDLGTGLVADSTEPGSVASISATGLGLSVWPIGVEHGWLDRDTALARSLRVLRLMRDGYQGPEPKATGYKGFYYHFVDPHTGRRAMESELSTIDTGMFLMGALTAAQYFDRDTPQERELRDTAEELYRRVDWPWAQNDGAFIKYAWTPEQGFTEDEWDGYDEAMLLYILGLASPTRPLGTEDYQKWTDEYEWHEFYGTGYYHAAPLFIHQFSHLWLDLRGIQDENARSHGIDYFENSRRATLIQQKYAVENPRGFRLYGDCCWGITASIGPGPGKVEVDGREIEFYGYMARGAPDGPDDGTLSPWAAAASLPFAPEIVIPTLDYITSQFELWSHDGEGFAHSFNPTYRFNTDRKEGWIAPWNYGIDQGPLLLMIENYRSGMIWELMRQNQHISRGLRRAGFDGGWLDTA